MLVKRFREASLNGVRVDKYVDAARNLGLHSTSRYVLQRLRDKLLRSNEPHSLTSRYARHPLRCRPGTTDINVFNQIFLHREYRCLDHVEDAALVVDCGAIVGYSSAYFLTRFPQAHVIAIEPDESNFAAPVANLAPYGQRSRALQTGVWSRPACLSIENASPNGGNEWGLTVREALAGEPGGVDAIDLKTVFDASGFDRVSVLKVDIEGSERDVFGTGVDQWLPRVDNLVIECHGRDCVEAVLTAAGPYGFKISRCDELFVFTRASL